jgi:hypothetical protein
MPELSMRTQCRCKSSWLALAQEEERGRAAHLHHDETQTFQAPRRRKHNRTHDVCDYVWNGAAQALLLQRGDVRLQRRALIERSI